MAMKRELDTVISALHSFAGTGNDLEISDLVLSSTLAIKKLYPPLVRIEKMKHFLVDIHYTAPIEKIDEILPLHRAFLQTGYDQGYLLCSGPKNPRTGGIVIARAESEDELRNFFKQDPYQQNQAARYAFIEFNPVKFQPFLEKWITGLE